MPGWTRFASRLYLLAYWGRSERPFFLPVACPVSSQSRMPSGGQRCYTNGNTSLEDTELAKKRDVYLEDLPMDEAWARLRRALEAVGRWGALPGEEEVPLDKALGRVTARPVWAALSSPNYHASAMDGYAVRAGDTVGATDAAPVRLDEITDDDADVERVARPARAINTGQPLPAWADAVIMVEHVQPVGEGQVEIRAAVAPWQHVRPMGEDMVATELVLPANHRLRPVDLGAAAGCGHAAVWVRRRPRAAVIPTGSELVSLEQAAQAPIQPGQIIDSNSLMLAAQVSAWGGVPTRRPIVPDEADAIRRAVQEAAAGHDLVLVNAGSSAGTEDYTAQVVRELGELLVHGVAVRPGHPVIFGMVGETVIIGVPGYPASAALTGEIFVRPLLYRWQGLSPDEPPTLQATLTRKVLSPMGDDEFLRVTVGQVGGRTIAAPLARGAGVLMSLVRADGIVRIPRFSEGVDAGEEVTVHLTRPSEAIPRTILAIGSHDMTLDLLAQFLAERAPGLRLASANVGSLAGLVALRRGEAHLAGSHLLDPATGEYNEAYVAQYLPETPVVLVTLVHREQGLMVPPGNPKQIGSIDDLARADVRFVNRQRGAGTRLLLDYELERRGIAPECVEGYHREMVTHLAVAAAVASGAADCGLGVRAAAMALGLDFVPVGTERYDLVIPREYYESDLLAPLLALLGDETFRAAVAALPGYDVSEMGKVVE
jgi:putative molybdopterin biosynthesis protein